MMLSKVQGFYLVFCVVPSFHWETQESLLVMLILTICTFPLIINITPPSFASLENVTYIGPSTLMGFLHYWILLRLYPISKNWSDSISNTTTQELTVSDSSWEEEGLRNVALNKNFFFRNASARQTKGLIVLGNLSSLINWGLRLNSSRFWKF
jgi:hypothetical protein